MRKYFQVSTCQKSWGSQVWDINQIRVQYEDQISDILDMIKSDRWLWLKLWQNQQPNNYLMVFLRSSDQEQRTKHNEKNYQPNKYLMVFLRSSDQESQSKPSNQRGPAGSRPKDENILIPFFIFRLLTNENIKVELLLPVTLARGLPKWFLNSRPA